MIDSKRHVLGKVGRAEAEIHVQKKEKREQSSRTPNVVFYKGKYTEWLNRVKSNFAVRLERDWRIQCVNVEKAECGAARGQVQIAAAKGNRGQRTSWRDARNR
jgi:hypothetical protein